MAAVVLAAATGLSCSSDGLRDAVEKSASSPRLRPAAAVVQGTAVAQRSIRGPRDAGSEAAVAVSCPPGRILISGGVLGDRSTGEAPSPSLRLHGTLPGRGGAQSWKAVGATGGQSERDGRTGVFALCRSQPIGAQVVTRSVPGPSRQASSATATATCPERSTALGGGGLTGGDDGGPGERQFFLTGTFPSDAHGKWVVTGDRPRSWSATGAVGGSALKHGRVTAYAVCAPDDQVGEPVEVVVTEERGPAAPGSFVPAVASCPAGAALLGGGAYSGLPDQGPPPQGLHLRGSFPSDSSGAATADGGAANSWTAVANAGGMVVIGARTYAFAVCAR